MASDAKECFSSKVEYCAVICLLDATNEEMCKRVRDLVYSDSRIQVEEITQGLGISHGSLSTILHDGLGMCKLTARWVPKSLSDSKWQPEHQYSAPC